MPQRCTRPGRQARDRVSSAWSVHTSIVAGRAARNSTLNGGLRKRIETTRPRGYRHGPDQNATGQAGTPGLRQSAPPAHLAPFTRGLCLPGEGAATGALAGPASPALAGRPVRHGTCPRQESSSAVESRRRHDDVRLGGGRHGARYARLVVAFSCPIWRSERLGQGWRSAASSVGAEGGYPRLAP